MKTSISRPSRDHPFFAATNTISYVVKDPGSKTCAAIDVLMDMNYAARRISYQPADKGHRCLCERKRQRTVFASFTVRSSDRFAAGFDGATDDARLGEASPLSLRERTLSALSFKFPVISGKFPVPEIIFPVNPSRELCEKCLRHSGFCL